MSVKVSRDSDKVIVRLPDGMRDRIKDTAEQNGRSMNAEIVATLGDAYPAPTPSDDVTRIVEWIMREISEPERERFINFVLDKHGVTAQDVADGLIPGVAPTDPDD